MSSDGAIAEGGVVDNRQSLDGGLSSEGFSGERAGFYIGALASLLVLSLALTLGLLYWSAKTQDEIAIESSHHLANTAIELQSSYLQKTLADYAWWDTAYKKTVETFDPDWFDSIFGDADFLRDTYGITASFVIAPDNRVLRYMYESEIAEDAETFDIVTRIEGGFGKLIEEARRTVDDEFLPVVGLVRMAGRLYFAAVRVIHPHSDDLLAEVAVTPANAYVAAMMRPVDSDLLRNLSSDFGLADLQFTPGRSPDTRLLSLPLQSIEGQTFGHLEWDIELPSKYTQSVELPALSAAIMTIGILGFYVLRHLRNNQRSLFHAMLKAQAADRAKVQFLSNVSHELRTPLNGVIGIAQILGRGELKDEQKKLLDTLLDSAKHQLTLVGDLLDLTRIESDHLELDHRPFDLSSVISETVALVEQKAASKGLAIETSFPENADPLIGDPIRFRQICLNLLDNAVKFTDSGSVAIALSTQTAGEFDDVEVSVKDTGIGIKDEHQKRIFTQFMQVDDSTTRTSEGLGLGLPICQALAGAMGGKISLESTPGEGSTFVVSLKLRRADTLGNIMQGVS